MLGIQSKTPVKCWHSSGMSAHRPSPACVVKRQAVAADPAGGVYTHCFCRLHHKNSDFCACAHAHTRTHTHKLGWLLLPVFLKPASPHFNSTQCLRNTADFGLEIIKYALQIKSQKATLPSSFMLYKKSLLT